MLFRSALDLKSAQDHALAEKMIAKADVVVENFRTGVMTRLGFDPEEMVKKYPKLIFASISGFGQYGPFEAGETERDAARREVFEEVGLKPKFDFDFQESYSYKVTSEIEKTVTLFLAKYKAGQKIKRQESMMPDLPVLIICSLITVANLMELSITTRSAMMGVKM